MSENQNIEYKSSWRDEYLKWICGFANAQGGRLFIGKDDTGNTIGLTDSKSQVETIPNKIRNMLGIICEVDLNIDNGNEYIEITVQPYSVPVSLRGRYYFRTGSNNLELTGNSLNEFLLRKAGKTWDDVIEEEANVDDIDDRSLQLFIADAAKSGRLPDITGLSKTELLEKQTTINLFNIRFR